MRINGEPGSRPAVWQVPGAVVVVTLAGPALDVLLSLDAPKELGLPLRLLADDARALRDAIERVTHVLQQILILPRFRGHL